MSMFDSFIIKPTAFGLDISDSSLKIIQLKKRGKSFALASFGETKMEPGIIEQGDIKNEKALSENIRKAVKEACGERIRTKRAIISLPVEKVYLDSQIISCDAKTGKLNVLIVAIPKTIIDSYVRSLKGAALEPVAFEIESMSISRALIKDNMDSQALVTVDLGENRTSFSIFFEQSLKFTATSQLSAKNFSELIAQSLKISFKEAEALKIKNGIGRSKLGKKITEALSSTLETLVDLSEKYLNYCQTQYNQKAAKILLCGGGANLKGLADFLSQRLKISVELGNPWTNIMSSRSKKAKMLTPEESLRYTTALGLALRGAKL